MNSLNKKFLENIAYNGENTKKWINASKEYLSSFINTNSILQHFSETITIVLHGSTTWNIDDEYSDLDFWLVLDDNELKRYRSITEQNFIPLEIKGKEGHVNNIGIHDFEQCFTNKIDMNLINETMTSIAILDKKNIFHKYQEMANRPISDSVRYAFFFNNYVKMRTYHRSSDNPMERGDEFAVLYNVMQSIKFALQAAFILDNSPYPHEKWLYTKANYLETPKSLFQNIDKIISEIRNNPNALFGPEKQNPISLQLREIRGKLIDKANSLGIEDLWLEKWWRYINKSEEIINNLSWS